MTVWASAPGCVALRLLPCAGARSDWPRGQPMGKCRYTDVEDLFAPQMSRILFGQSNAGSLLSKQNGRE